MQTVPAGLALASMLDHTARALALRAQKRLQEGSDGVCKLVAAQKAVAAAQAYHNAAGAALGRMSLDPAPTSWRGETQRFIHAVSKQAYKLQQKVELLVAPESDTL